MKWLWNTFKRASGIKSKIVSLGTMALALAIAGSGLIKLATHERAQGEVVRVEKLCDVKCDKLARTAANSKLNGSQCTEVAAAITRLELEDCVPRGRDYYAVRFEGTDGAEQTQTLSSSKFDSSHSVGDTVAILRDPDDPAAVEPPPGWIVYAALAYGLILLVMHILWPLIRRRKKRVSA